MLIAMTGLPGTGKTMFAEALGIALPATVVSVDQIELAMWRAGLPRTEATGIAGYAVAAAVTEQQLRLGHDVITDAVNADDAPRRIWKNLAKGYDGELYILEVVCSDLELHRAWVEERCAEALERERREHNRHERGLPASTTVHPAMITWADVERRAGPTGRGRSTGWSSTQLKTSSRTSRRRCGCSRRDRPRSGERPDPVPAPPPHPRRRTRRSRRSRRR